MNEAVTRFVSKLQADIYIGDWLSAVALAAPTSYFKGKIGAVKATIVS